MLIVICSNTSTIVKGKRGCINEQTKRNRGCTEEKSEESKRSHIEERQNMERRSVCLLSYVLESDLMRAKILLMVPYLLLPSLRVTMMLVQAEQALYRIHMGSYARQRKKYSREIMLCSLRLAI